MYVEVSGHHVRRVHKKIRSWRLEQVNGHWARFGLLSPKTPDSSFVDNHVRRVDQKFHFPDSNKLKRNIRLIWATVTETLDSKFVDIMYVVFMKYFHLSDWNKLAAIRLISNSCARKHLILIF